MSAVKTWNPKILDKFPDTAYFNITYDLDVTTCLKFLNYCDEVAKKRNVELSLDTLNQKYIVRKTGAGVIPFPNFLEPTFSGEYQLTKTQTRLIVIGKTRVTDGLIRSEFDRLLTEFKKINGLNK